jgi:hypothetical protein
VCVCVCVGEGGVCVHNATSLPIFLRFVQSLFAPPRPTAAAAPPPSRAHAPRPYPPLSLSLLLPFSLPPLVHSSMPQLLPVFHPLLGFVSSYLILTSTLPVLLQRRTFSM